MTDTRKDRRAPVSLKVRFKSATVDEFIEQYSKDVSRGGIFIKSSQPMAVGTLLKFQFQLKDESALIRGVGRVVWTRAEEHAGAERPAGMGIKFIKMDPESKATVDRVIDAHGDNPGSYESGRKTATHAEAESMRPPPSNGGGGAFFPETTPMNELPPPEDRTAVRHAAQFIASALSGAGTDEAAAREAEQKGEEARKRSAQIEAERALEADRRKKAQVAGENLPSMIIDPSLDVHAPLIEPAPVEPPPAPPARAPAAEAATQHSRPSKPPARQSNAPKGKRSSKPPGKRSSKPPPAKPKGPPSQPPAGLTSEDDTSITDRKHVSAQVSAKVSEASQPVSVPPPPAKKSYLVPALVIGLAVAIAAFLALRTPEEPAEPIGEVPAAQVEPAPVPPAPTPAEPAPTPAPEPSVEPPATAPSEQAAPTPGEPAPVEPAPAEPAPAEPAPAEPAPAVEAAAPGAAPAVAKTGKVRVVTLPAGALVLVNDKQRGKSPLMLDLPKGTTFTITARTPGHADASQLVTPGVAPVIVQLRLEPLEYILRVETTPSGASVSVAGKRGTSPVEIIIPAPPKTGTPISARLVGYETASGKATPGDFTAAGSSMRGTVRLTLAPFQEAPRETKPAPAPKPQAPAETAPAPAEPKPEPKPAEPKPAEPKPAEPKPAEPKPDTPIPDNPFG